VCMYVCMYVCVCVCVCVWVCSVCVCVCLCGVDVCVWEKAPAATYGLGFAAFLTAPQPLQPCLFPCASLFSTVRGVSNPYAFQADGVK
jgi:hypothetical protein